MTNSRRELTVNTLSAHYTRLVADILVTSTVEINALQLKEITNRIKTIVINDAIGAGFDSGKTEGWNIGKAVGKAVVLKQKEIDKAA